MRNSVAHSEQPVDFPCVTSNNWIAKSQLIQISLQNNRTQIRFSIHDEVGYFNLFRNDAFEVLEKKPFSRLHVKLSVVYNFRKIWMSTIKVSKSGKNLCKCERNKRYGRVLTG